MAPHLGLFLLFAAWSRAIPPQAPTEIKELAFPPRGRPPPPLRDMPTAEVDVRLPPPQSLSALPMPFPLTTDPDLFPSEPPEPPPSSDPPPLSPVGRWLHTAVLMGNKMYVYGGVASYNRRLDNDVWLYDLGAQEWSELQASFVPSSAGGVADSATTADARPYAVPAAPPLRESPDAPYGRVKIPIRKAAGHQGGSLPTQHKPVHVVDLEPLLLSPIKPDFFNGDAQPSRQRPLDDAGVVIAVRNSPRDKALDNPRVGLRAGFDDDENEAIAPLQVRDGASNPGIDVDMGSASPNDNELALLGEAESVARTPIGDPFGRVKIERKAKLGEKLRVSGPFSVDQWPYDPTGYQWAPPVDEASLAEALASTPQSVPRSIPLAPSESKSEPYAQSHMSVASMHRLGPAERAPAPMTSGTPRLDRSAQTVRGLAAGVTPPVKVFEEMRHSELIEEESNATVWPPFQSFLETREGDLPHQHRAGPRGHVDHRRRKINHRRRIINDDESKAGLRSNEPPVYNLTRHRHRRAGAKHIFVMADLWAYDLLYKRWEAVNPAASAPVPIHRYLHSAVVWSDGNPDFSQAEYRMLVFGGVTWTNEIAGDLWLFDPKKTQWLQAAAKGTPPSPREGHSAVMVRKNGAGVAMLVFGGVSYQFAPFNDLYEYNVAKNTWTKVKAVGAAPEPRWMHSAVMDSPRAGPEPGSVDWDSYKKPKMYVFGGCTLGSVPLDSLFEYDVSAKKWTRIVAAGYPPFPRMLHSMSYAHGRLFVMFGAANNIRFDDMYYFDTSEMRWHEVVQVHPFPFAREGSSAILVTPPQAEAFPDYSSPWRPQVGGPRRTLDDAAKGKCELFILLIFRL